MKHKFYGFLLIIFIFTHFSSMAVSQDTKLKDLKSHRFKKTDAQHDLENEIKELKKQDKFENLPRIIELNKELEEINGTGKTESGSIFNGNNNDRLVNFNLPSYVGINDDIQNTRIYTNSSRNIKGIAGAIEQRGSTAGKLWSVVFYSADSTSPDTFRVYYSVNNGQSWSEIVSGNIRPGDFVTPNDIDMELVENNTGQKYLWVAFGFKRVSGRKAVGAFVIQVPSINGTFYNMLEWPVSDSLKSYYNIRLTTDNSQYAATPFIYIACSFDSTDSNGNRINSQKFARILSPYSINNPAFSFLAPKFYWYENSGAVSRTTYTDIAYFNNSGEDSLIVSFCGVQDSTKLFFAKSDILGNPPVSSAGAGGNIGGSNPNSIKTHARLSSNGNSNGSIVCTFRELNNSNWNVKWISSANFGNFEAQYSDSPLLGSQVHPNFAPEITAVRNGNTHYISFMTNASDDSIHYIAMNLSGQTSHIYKMNYYSGSEIITPKPLFRYQNGDSCLMLYSEDGPHNMVSSAGCSGVPIGINGINEFIPGEYRLMQNYPNPFNPETNISFSIPANAYVKIIVYDISGKEVKVLADSDFTPGSYELKFDGSSFASGVYFCRLDAATEGSITAGYTDIKKMVLLK